VKPIEKIQGAAMQALEQASGLTILSSIPSGIIVLAMRNVPIHIIPRKSG